MIKQSCDYIRLNGVNIFINPPGDTCQTGQHSALNLYKSVFDPINF